MTHEQWWAVASAKLEEQDGKCGVCGHHLSLNEYPRPELAHQIPDTVAFRAMYGRPVLEHPLNKVLVCTRKFHECNDAILLGAARPVEREALVAEIREAMAQPLGA